MSLLGACQWLAETHGSAALRESLYMYPLIESLHVLTLCLFVGMAVLLDLRLLGVVLPQVRASEMADRLLPWMKLGFAVMVMSGVTLFYAIPVRSYQNIFFRIKMIALVLAGLNAWLFQIGVRRRTAEWDLHPVPPRAARVAGAASLALWAVIIVSGRMIAYNWFDCARQPQSDFINWATGCETSTSHVSRLTSQGEAP
jgi:hypothetical protein